MASIRSKEIVDTLLPMQTRGSLEYLRRTKQALDSVVNSYLAKEQCNESVPLL
jgi:hypothetical protein